MFLNDYFMGTYLETEIIHDRNHIRSSDRLNALLADNIFPLRKIFYAYAKPIHGGANNCINGLYVHLDQIPEIFMKSD